MNQIASTPAVQMAAAVAAASMAAATATALTAHSTAVDQPRLPVNEDRRDPQLRAFEQYLLQNLRASDVTTDEEGVYLFNVNQVAYLVEGSASKDEKRMTRQRVGAGLQSVSHVLKATPGCNLGNV